MYGGISFTTGFNHVCSVEHFPEDKWNDMVAVMLSAPFHLTKRFIPSMRKKGILCLSISLGLNAPLKYYEILLQVMYISTHLN